MDGILPCVGCIQEITESGTYRCGHWLVTAYFPPPEAESQARRFDMYDERGVLVEQRAERNGIMFKRHRHGGYWSTWRLWTKPFVW